MAFTSQEKRNLKLIAVISIAGIIIASYLLVTKYTGYQSFCDFSAEVSCDAVNQSPYAEFPANSGIPISGLGIIAFLLFLVPSYLLLRGNGRPVLGIRRPAVYRLLSLWWVFSILFFTYLTYLELYVIYAICPLCVVEFLITILMGLFIVQNVRTAAGKRRKK